MEKKFRKIFLILVIMLFEPVAGTCLYYEENSCDPQSRCYQAVLRSQIWVREDFYNSVLSWINRKLGWKYRHGEFVIVLDAWTRWFLKGVLKRKPSGIQVTTFFGVSSFQNIWAITLIFFSKCAKIFINFGNAKRNPENVFFCCDNNSWTSCGNFTLLWGKFMWSAVDVLPNSPKIQIWLREMFSNSLKFMLLAGNVLRNSPKISDVTKTALL